LEVLKQDVSFSETYGKSVVMNNWCRKLSFPTCFCVWNWHRFLY